MKTPPKTTTYNDIEMIVAELDEVQLSTSKINVKAKPYKSLIDDLPMPPIKTQGNETKQQWEKPSTSKDHSVLKRPQSSQNT